HSGKFVPALLLKLVGELHDKNSVLGNQSDKRNQTDLTIDVQRREAEEREHQSASQGQRNRSGQHDEWIAEALELRRQYEVNQDGRQQECSEELAAFHAHPTRLTRTLEGV